MKTSIWSLSLVVAGLCAVAVPVRAAEPGGTKPAADERTFSSLDRPGERDEDPPGMRLEFAEAELDQVLKMYQQVSRRTVIRANLPAVKITLRSEMPLGRIETLQLLDTVLAEHGVVMVLLGTRHVKAVNLKEAATEAAPIVDLPRELLPESHTYLCYVVTVKGRLPREMAQALQPFARLPNSILAIDSAGMLVLRDFSVNVRRMLEVIERMERAPRVEVEKSRGTPPPPPPPRAEGRE
jgi:type II secretory pathway component GspD/PulD (secretin)